MRKGILSLMLSSLVLISLSTISLAQTQAAVSSTYRGDINEDGQVNIFDLLEILKMLGSQQGQTERKRQISDMDTNGKTDIYDLLGLLKVLGGQQPEVIYWGPTITGLSNTVAAVGDTLVAYLENIDEATTIGDVSVQINEQDVEILVFTQDSVGIIIPQWFAGGQLRLVVADDTTNSVLTLAFIPGVVNSTTDSGTGSLRDAITNASPGDSITFDPSVFPPASPDTIALVSTLPGLDQGSLVIDASDAGVVIDGSMISESEANCISIFSNNNVIRGLHIKDFSKAGIALEGGAQNNTIGGDRNIGEGPSGQGNMITGTGYVGIGLWVEGTSYNTIQGNIIGTDISGTVAVGQFGGGIIIGGANYNLIESNLIGGYVDHGVSISGVNDGHNTVRGNFIGTDTSGVIKISHSDWYGVFIDNSGYNVVGPSNVIAHNEKSGIIIQGEESVGNRITQNSIYNNGSPGIVLYYGGNAQLAVPVLYDFDKLAGTVTGMACANCTVEVFSDNDDQGEIYEGQTTADNTGFFTFTRGASFTQSHLTATATDTNGNTSKFSVPTPDVPSRNLILQEGNNLFKTRLQAKRSGELTDNLIMGGNDLPWILDLGVTRAGFSINEIEWNVSAIRWYRSEFKVTPGLDNFVSILAANGMKLLNQMSFWDKANHPQGEGWPATDGWQPEDGYSRFQTDEEIERYIEFVRFNVQHFKDRVQYYEFWCEPDNSGLPVQYIKVPDYINLVKRVAPVIRQEYPEAKIVFGSVVLQHSQDYFFELLKSEEIMPLVDVLSWHPLFGVSPAYDSEYYYDYPSIAQAIKDTAAAHGFIGEYIAEAGWSSVPTPGNLSTPVYSEVPCAKYHVRAIVMHRSLDIITEVGGLFPEFVLVFNTISNLCTVMAGTTTDSVDIQIQSDADYLRSCSFSLPDGQKMVALWTDGIAEDDDPGVAATLTLPWPSAQSVKAIDVLNGYEQQLISSVEEGNLVIRGFLVKDYPIFIQASQL